MKHHETLEHSSFDETISALDAEMLALGAATSAIAWRSFNATISGLDEETSGLDEETSAIAQTYRQYRRGDIGDCGVGVPPQMSNRVTNHGDMATFSRPEPAHIMLYSLQIMHCIPM